ncbi:MAG: glycosyltransferase, partial [Dehalococcoidales bacterium]|nr:glycosyltransferase [Dehalococcoidales bacterium]
MAEKKPVISIVVPVLNEEALLADCLRSLQNQDYTGHYEIIIVDNGSTDRSISIAQEYGVRVLYSPIKRNVFTAREYGARATRGDIVVQADADTIYPRDWLTRITRHLNSHPEAVAVAGTFKYRAPTNWARVEYFLRHLAAIFTIIIFGRPFLVSGANFAFRKRAFVQVNGYDQSLFAPDQYGIVTQLSKAGKILYDRKLSVATSSRRRADKSLLRLTGDVLRNFSFGIGRLLKDYVKHSLKRTPETRARRWSRRRLLPTLAGTIVFLMISLITYGYFLPSSQVFGKVYYKGDTTHKVVALTFDDGPNEPYT